MGELVINFEWESPGVARGPELRATWARLHILVTEQADQPVTRVFDQLTRSVRDEIYLPLYPLAEWVATNWWSLLYEVSSPSRMQLDGYARRHNLMSAGEGFALPPLRIEPEGEYVRIAWEPADLPDCRVRFLSHGLVHLDVRHVEDRLRSFVSAVVARLEDEGITGTLLAEEWHAIQHADPEEQAFCRAAAELGCDPYDLEEKEAERIVEVLTWLPREIVDEFLASAYRSQAVDQGRAVQLFIESAAQTEGELTSLRELRSASPGLNARQPPWEQGYSFAGALRDQLRLRQERIRSLTDLSKLLKVSPGQFDQEAEQPALRFLDAVVAMTRNGSPCFYVTKHHVQARTFALCRALFEYLSASAEQAALVTPSYSERQKRNRAFAAEFIAPMAELRKSLKARVITEEDILELADEFGTSDYVIRHQIRNHHLAEIAEWRV